MDLLNLAINNVYSPQASLCVNVSTKKVWDLKSWTLHLVGDSLILFHLAKMLTILGLLAVFLIPRPSLTEGKKVKERDEQPNEGRKKRI